APRFVEFVERGVTSRPELLAVARECLAPILAADVDPLVLGRIHYPLLTAVSQYVVGDAAWLVSSAEEPAKGVFAALVAGCLVRGDTGGPARHRFLSTGEPTAFNTLAQRFLGPEVGAESAAEITGEIPVVGERTP